MTDPSPMHVMCLINYIHYTYMTISRIALTRDQDWNDLENVIRIIKRGKTKRQDLN